MDIFLPYLSNAIVTILSYNSCGLGDLGINFYLWDASFANEAGLL